MDSSDRSFASTLPRDLTAGLVVFLVAIPLCLGIALASNAPLLSGVLSGMIGGLVVGLISGSHTSVSGPAAGLAAVVAAEIAALGSFPTFLLAVVIAGALQIGLGVARAGGFAAFLPSSVIKGLLAAIGVLLILKQFPHVLGHDADPEGEMAFQQPDHSNTFAELFAAFGHIHPGAAAIGLGSLALLVAWGKIKTLKESVVPAPLVVVLLGVVAYLGFSRLGAPWAIEPSHLVQVPVAKDVAGFFGLLQVPDFSQWTNLAVYRAAVTLAIVASLETMLNLEAVDQIDPQQRTSPPNRELIAQGVGNMTAGLVGGIPITSVIVRSSVNVNAGARTKLSAVFHGVLLSVSVVFLPTYLNMIPLASLAAILLHTGFKLASPDLVKQMWSQGRYQFLPFATTVIAIVFTDLLIGVLIGLGVSLAFILNSNLRRPIRQGVEKHLGGDVLRVELSNQVSFLNRAALHQLLDDVPPGGHVLLDGRHADYIDPDVLALIHDFNDKTAPARGVKLSLLGFRTKYNLPDVKRYDESSTRAIQDQLTPAEVLQILKDGHARFRRGERLTRDLGQEMNSAAGAQHPLAVVLSCIDSRAPIELIFDLGLGDVLSIRIAGNVLSPEVLGSMEFACATAGAKLILVMGHTRCGAVTAAVEAACAADDAGSDDARPNDGCRHMTPIVRAIQESMDSAACRSLGRLPHEEKVELVDSVARRNVARTTEQILQQSETLNRLQQSGRIAIVGAMYDVATGDIELAPLAELVAK